MEIKKIYILGNPLAEFDGLPIRLMPKLAEEFPAIRFELIDPNENLHPENKKLFIIDTIINADDVVILDDMEAFDDSPRYSMHDLDLAFTLKLLKKLGELDDFTVIGLPPDMGEEEALKKIRKILY